MSRRRRRSRARSCSVHGSTTAPSRKQATMARTHSGRLPTSVSTMSPRPTPRAASAPASRPAASDTSPKRHSRRLPSRSSATSATRPGGAASTRSRAKFIRPRNLDATGVRPQPGTPAGAEAGGRSAPRSAGDAVGGERRAQHHDLVLDVGAALLDQGAAPGGELEVAPHDGRDVADGPVGAQLDGARMQGPQLRLDRARLAHEVGEVALLDLRVRAVVEHVQRRTGVPRGADQDLGGPLGCQLGAEVGDEVLLEVHAGVIGTLPAILTALDAQCAIASPSHTIASETTKIAPSRAWLVGRRRCAATRMPTSTTRPSLTCRAPSPQSPKWLAIAAPVTTSTAMAASVPAPKRRAIARSGSRAAQSVPRNAGTTAAARTSCPPT